MKRPMLPFLYPTFFNLDNQEEGDGDTEFPTVYKVLLLYLKGKSVLNQTDKC